MSDNATVVVVEAARLVANGRKVRWCTQHISSAIPSTEKCLVKTLWKRRDDCVFVDAIIVLTRPGDTE